MDLSNAVFLLLLALVQSVPTRASSSAGGPSHLGKPATRGGHNQMSYDAFAYNPDFSTFKPPSTPLAITAAQKKRYDDLMRRACDRHLNSSERHEWQPIADALADSYENEQGAVVYSADEGKFTFCGFVELLQNSFMGGPGERRLCAFLKAIGLDGITRKPMLGGDWFSREMIADIREEVEAALPIMQEEDRMFKVMRVDYDLATAVYVNLFSDENRAEDFVAACKIDADYVFYTSCSAMCCSSAYIDIEFCKGYPNDCAD